MKKLIVSSLLLSLVGCSGEQQVSKISGHYEDMTKAEAETLVSSLNPVAVAEHDLTDSLR
ncbi:MAG: hypothetical protein ACOH5I_01470 [Oligoflexus sp.]